jgi:hypothetical protein
MKKKLSSIIVFQLLFCFINAQSSWNPEICLVTVDSATSTYISVIWNKPVVNDIDSFYIYRADSNQTNFSKIASVSYADSSVYDDIGVNVNTTWYSYLISAIDTNGIEGLKSDTANTCLLNVVPNIASGYFKCMWNSYKNGANNPTFVRCMWDSLGNTSGLQQIGVNWAPTLTSWNHLGYSQAAQSVYRLENEVSNPCSPERGVINTSRSNVRNVANPLTLSNDLNSLFEKLTRIFPNPGSDFLNIEWNPSLEITSIELVDALGKKISDVKVGNNQLKETLNITELDRGVYFILFVGKNGINKKRFVAIR